MSGERTEKASPQKRRKATERGDRLVSRELIAAAAMLAGVLSLKAMAAHWNRTWNETYRASIRLVSSARPSIEPAELAGIARTLVLHSMTPVLFFAASSVAGALLLGVAQGGGRLTPALLLPRWSRVSPAGHLKTVFGLQSILRLGKSLAPAAVVGFVAFARLVRQPWTPRRDFSRIDLLFGDVYALLLATATAMTLWAGLDYISTWRTREARLRMTKQDVKEEMKEAEGSPQIKRRIRQMQRQMRKRQLRADVSKATVVLTNPTHYAVALSFDFVRMEAPKVLAKGMNLIALEIRETAQWAGVPIVENPPLARSLYRSVEPGQSIPFELYAAVAGILAYLYRKDVEARAREGKGSREGANPDEIPKGRPRGAGATRLQPRP